MRNKKHSRDEPVTSLLFIYSVSIDKMIKKVLLTGLTEKPDCSERQVALIDKNGTLIPSFLIFMCVIPPADD